MPKIRFNPVFRSRHTMNTSLLKTKRIVAGISMLAFGAMISLPTVQACTRVVYLGEYSTVITGRSMDWAEDMRSNLWIFPRGISRDGAAGPSSPKWTSKYGSVIASGYDVGTADGMNEKGLVANLLYLAESNYGTPDQKPALSISLWAQYVLDNFATVNEAVDHLKTEPFKIVAPPLPNGRKSNLHLSISDASGDSAIFEYIDGKLEIHHGRQYQVMTNSPNFDDQLALNAYWKSIGGLVFLPGTNRAADRFARASFLVDAVPKTTDKNYIDAVPQQKYQYQAVASTLGIMRSVGVPLGITTPNQPNISSTIWRTVADQKNKIYYFDSATTPNTFWIDFKDVDFSNTASIKKLTVAGGKIYAGNTANLFETAKSFEFLKAAPGNH